MTRKATEQVTTIGIDICKNTLHLIGLDAEGNIVLRRKLSRSQMMVRLANLPPCLIGMEACVGAHHLSRQLQDALCADEVGRAARSPGHASGALTPGPASNLSHQPDPSLAPRAWHRR